MQQKRRSGWKKVIMVPTDIKELPVSFMNEDHREFSIRLDQLEQLVSTGKEEHFAEIDCLFADLLEHTREHFARENEEMARINFPPYQAHRAEHERVLAGLEELLERWESERDIAWLKVQVDNLAMWFEMHLETMDTVTAHFIAQANPSA